MCGSADVRTCKMQKKRKMALTCTPNPNPPTRSGPDPNQSMSVFNLHNISPHFTRPNNIQQQCPLLQVVKNALVVARGSNRVRSTI